MWPEGLFMKTCFIYSDLVLDLEIALNLEAFYKRLGFTTCFCRDRIRDADLLVILRPVNRPLDFSGYHHNVIHIYDYEGKDINIFMRSSIDYKKTYIFCMSEKQKNRITDKAGFPANQVFVVLLPVEIPLWVSKLKDIKYELVHIGNHKPIRADEDLISQRFHEAVTSLKADVWGAEWEGFIGGGRYHGKAGRFEAQPIYARSRFALGLMYPFQRELTFSSRFWQAPLNGCQLLSESGLYTRTFPGIIETDYSVPDLKEKLQRVTDREALRARARRFWEEQNKLTLSYVKPTLESIKERDLGVRERLFFMRISVGNLITKCFHTKFLPKWVRKILIFLRDGTKPHVTRCEVPTL